MLELQVVRHMVVAVVMVVISVAVKRVALRQAEIRTARSVLAARGTIMTSALALRVSHGTIHSILCLTLR